MKKIFLILTLIGYANFSLGSIPTTASFSKEPKKPASQTESAYTIANQPSYSSKTLALPVQSQDENSQVELDISYFELLNPASIIEEHSLDLQKKGEKKSRKRTKRGSNAAPFKGKTLTCDNSACNKSFEIKCVRKRPNDILQITCPHCQTARSYTYQNEELVPSKKNHKKSTAFLSPNERGKANPCPFCGCQRILKNGATMRCSNPNCLKATYSGTKYDKVTIPSCPECNGKKVFILNPKEPKEPHNLYCYDCSNKIKSLITTITHYINQDLKSKINSLLIQGKDTNPTLKHNLHKKSI